ncbi:MAG: hypothetical protein ABIV63_02365 [Caldimonas sp.]
MTSGSGVIRGRFFCDDAYMIRTRDMTLDLNMIHRGVSVGLGFLGAAAILAGCGGGGGDSAPASGVGGGAVVPPVTSPSTFNLRSGYSARISGGSDDTFTVSGTCVGTAHIVNSVPVASSSTFAGVSPYFSADNNTQVTLSQCAPPFQTQAGTSQSTGTNYFDSSYVPLGSFIPGPPSEYAEFQTRPVAFPSAATVGMSGTYLTLLTYPTSGKAPGSQTGRKDFTYEVKADTATTAVVKLTTAAFDTSGSTTPRVQQVTCFRMAADGTLSLISISTNDATSTPPQLLSYRTQAADSASCGT